MEYMKSKSPAKTILTREGQKGLLPKMVRSTMRTISDLVGATLGPGGRPVLIERYEYGLPVMLTKDGVTVFRAIGLEDPVAHCIMEMVRDCAVRTASEAGDGTTTATILAEALVRYMDEYCKKHRRTSPQLVMRHLQQVFAEKIEPAVKLLSRKVGLSDPEDLKLLKAVARVSANGDDRLAEAVMQCFGITGDAGNVTITERPGTSGYDVQKVEGYSITAGYEDHCKNFWSKFITDQATQMCVMPQPAFILYHGALHDIGPLANILRLAGTQFELGGRKNFVVVATGFSDEVLANLAANFASPDTMNVYPLVAPISQMPNGQLDFLQDVAAITGAKIFDPMNNPIQRATVEELGPGVDKFEAGRWRSNILGYADEDLVLIRTEEIEQQIKDAVSELHAMLLRERLAQISGGLARLIVMGSSNGEVKEARDRAEDAVCAVRGAVKHGCLPGGGWTLLKLCNLLGSDDEMVNEIIKPAFQEPIHRLMANSGIIDEQQIMQILEPVFRGIVDGQPIVYDFMGLKHVNAFEAGILDSTPAVLEAIRNSMSIAVPTGTLGGAVVFKRDLGFERSEARDAADFVRNANTSEADERP